MKRALSAGDWVIVTDSDTGEEFEALALGFVDNLNHRNAVHIRIGGELKLVRDVVGFGPEGKQTVVGGEDKYFEIYRSRDPLLEAQFFGPSDADIAMGFDNYGDW